MSTDPAPPGQEIDPESIETEIGQIARGAGLGLGGNIYLYFINFLFGIIVARQIGADAFGYYTLGMTAVMLLSQLASVGLDRGALRYISIKREDGDGSAVRQVILLSLGIGTVVSLIFAVVVGVFPQLFLQLFHWTDKTYLLQLLPVFAVGLPFMTVGMISVTGTQGFRTMRYRTLIASITQPTTKLLVTLLMIVLLGATALAPAIGFVSARVVSAVLAVFFLWRLALKLPRAGGWQPGLTTELLRYSLPLLLSGVLIYLNGRTEIIVLGIYNQADASGIYNAALRLAGLTLIVLNAFSAIFSPLIADLHHRGEMKELEALFKLVTRWIIIVALPIFLVQFLFPEQLISLFGKDFIPGAPALRILSLGVLINFSTGAVALMLLMSGYSGLAMFNSFLTLLVAFGLDFLLIPRFGLMGAAVAGMLSIAAIHLVDLSEVWYLLGIHPYNRYTLRPFIAAAPALLGGWLWSQWLPVNSLLQLSAATIVVGLIYVAALMLIGWGEDDRMMMAALSKRIKRLVRR